MVFTNDFLQCLYSIAYNTGNDVEENPGPTLFDVIDPTRTMIFFFFKSKKVQMKIFWGKLQVAPRKCKGNNRNLTAGHLKQEGGLERLVHLDKGYKFLRALRGSPPYFERAKKDIFAMITQLGPATLFYSFSSAETKWIHLLRILGKLVDDKEYSDSELENLNWGQESRLIQGDPVNCARHFDYQFNQFLRYFLMSNAAPLGKVADWF